MQLPSDPAEADATLVSLHGALEELAADAKDALDLDLHLGKCALLLPQATSPPPTASPAWR